MKKSRIMWQFTTQPHGTLILEPTNPYGSYGKRYRVTELPPLKRKKKDVARNCID